MSFAEVAAESILCSDLMKEKQALMYSTKTSALTRNKCHHINSSLLGGSHINTVLLLLKLFRPERARLQEIHLEGDSFD